MKNIILDKIALNITNIFLKDANNNPIYPGDILIKFNQHFDNFEMSLKRLKYITPANNYLKIFDELKKFNLDITFFNFDCDIVTAEYFYLNDIKEPVLYFHGLEQTFHFDNIIDERTTRYKHLTDEEANRYKIGLIPIFENFGETIEIKYNFLKSNFGKNYKILKIIDTDDDKKLICFEYRFKDNIEYKKAKAYQRGILIRENWFKNKIGFPELYYYINGKNIFDEYINKVDKSDYFLFKIIYYVENKLNLNKNHESLEIFCTKNKNLNKRIYFFKGKKGK